MTKEEWEKEPDEYKIEWGNNWMKRVLTRGPTFRFTHTNHKVFFISHEEI